MRGLLFIFLLVVAILVFQAWQARRAQAARMAQYARRQATRRPTHDDVIEMVACPACGTYFDPEDTPTRPYCSDECRRHRAR